MKPSEIIADEIRDNEVPMSDRLARALEAVELLEQQKSISIDALKEIESSSVLYSPDFLRKIATEALEKMTEPANRTSLREFEALLLSKGLPRHKCGINGVYTNPETAKFYEDWRRGLGN